MQPGQTAPSDSVLDGKVGNLMHLMEARSHRITINAFDSDDRGVCTGPYAPHVQVGNARIPRPFDEFADFLFEMTFMRVEQNARGVTHQ